jgi:hypothetical protein
MLYDQAEAVMAKLADTYPQRDSAMVLPPREDADQPRSYSVQTSVPEPTIGSEELTAYQAIADESRLASEFDAVNLNVTGTGMGGLTVVFN